jgi:hypothetical protein
MDMVVVGFEAGAEATLLVPDEVVSGDQALICKVLTHQRSPISLPPTVPLQAGTMGPMLSLYLVKMLPRRAPRMARKELQPQRVRRAIRLTNSSGGFPPLTASINQFQ